MPVIHSPHYSIVDYERTRITAMYKYGLYHMNPKSMDRPGAWFLLICMFSLPETQ